MDELDVVAGIGTLVVKLGKINNIEVNKWHRFSISFMPTDNDKTFYLDDVSIVELDEGLVK